MPLPRPLRPACPARSSLWPPDCLGGPPPQRVDLAGPGDLSAVRTDPAAAIPESHTESHPESHPEYPPEYPPALPTECPPERPDGAMADEAVTEPKEKAQEATAPTRAPGVNSVSGLVGSIEGNLWACPLVAATATHFDSRHNLLLVLFAPSQRNPDRHRTSATDLMLTWLFPPGLPMHPRTGWLRCNGSLSQVLSGRKSVALWSPADSRRLAPPPSAGPSANHAADPAGPAVGAGGGVGGGPLSGGASGSLSESAAGPPGRGMASLFGCDSPAVVTVLPGEALFIPEGWWHQARRFSLTHSLFIFPMPPFLLLRTPSLTSAPFLF